MVINRKYTVINIYNFFHENFGRFMMVITMEMSSQSATYICLKDIIYEKNESNLNLMQFKCLIY